MLEKVPVDVQRVINDILGPDFKVKMESYSDRPGFLCHIHVPFTHTNLDKKTFDSLGGDVRTKAITNAEGLNGVKIHCEVIAKQLKGVRSTERPPATR